MYALSTDYKEREFLAKYERLLLQQERWITGEAYDWGCFHRSNRFEMKLKEAARLRERMQEEAQAQVIAWRTERLQRNTMLDFWLRRHTLHLTANGSAVIERDSFAKWLKQIDKLLPTKKARRDYGRGADKDDDFEAVTFDLVKGKLVASFLNVTPEGVTFASIAKPYPCKLSEGTFTVTVNFDTLRELVDVSAKGEMILRKELGIGPLTIEQGRTRDRLKHRTLNQWHIQ